VIITPSKSDVPREEAYVNSPQHQTRILPRNELYMDASPQKRGYSMPKT
jgi:hypothetical protein